MQAVILAAGQGSRLQRLGTSKPLVPLLGMSLLERNIRCLEQIGVHHIIVVTGHEAEAVASALPPLQAQFPQLTLQAIHNPDWASTENGQSLAVAAEHLDQNFLLLMADHVYAPALLEDLCAQTPPDKGAILAIDRRLYRDDIDLEDVTKVQLNGSHIQHLAKDTAEYQAFDTGAFWCSPDALPTLQAAIKEGNTRLSEMMAQLIAKQKLLAYDSGDAYWQDVDTPESHHFATQHLLAAATQKSGDGPIAKYLNRPLSRRLSQHFANAGVSPNHISVLAFLIGLLAAWLLSMQHYGYLVLGGVAVQLASIVDGCDGEVARIHLRSSSFGGWFDAILDRYADAAILAGLTWHAMALAANGWLFFLGLLAISGSFVASYSAHKCDALTSNNRWRMGRDTRSFLILLGTLANAVVPLLLLLAVLMNLTVIARLWRMRNLLD